MSFRVALLARSPQLGRVKTRLAAELGAEKALRLHESMLTLMCSRLGAWAPGAVTLWVDKDPDHPFVADLANRYELPVQVQCAGDLGSKISFALNTELTAGGSALVVGADCVGLNRGDLVDAAYALKNGSDLALGPATDGGYYLLGLGRERPRLFDSVEWGTETVYRQTLKNAEALGLRVTELPVRSDLDRIEDLKQLDEQTLDLLGLGSWLSCPGERS